MITFGSFVKSLLAGFAFVPAPLLWLLAAALVGAVALWLRSKIREGC